MSAQPARWERTSERSTWCASTGSMAMYVTKTPGGRWRAAVEDARSPEFLTRLIAQRWAEKQAGAR